MRRNKVRPSVGAKKQHRFKIGECIIMSKKEKLFITWSLMAVILSILFSILLKASFPLFTLIWIGVPLIVVLRKKDTGFVGFSGIPLKEFIKVTLINLGITLAIIGLFEPWSHTYQTLIRLATDSNTPDVTFAWLKRYNGVKSWLGMFIFGGFVTMFGEEIFFRGWLFQFLKKRINPYWAIIIQALLFIIPNLIAALFMSRIQGVIYTVIYTGIAIGVAGGWAAKRTNSIWPSLVSASIVNLLAVIVLF
jgi:membrane protease YdiL (CAAX protease family)